MPSDARVADPRAWRASHHAHNADLVKRRRRPTPRRGRASARRSSLGRLNTGGRRRRPYRASFDTLRPRLYPDQQGGILWPRARAAFSVDLPAVTNNHPLRPRRSRKPRSRRPVHCPSWRLASGPATVTVVDESAEPHRTAAAWRSTLGSLLCFAALLVVVGVVTVRLRDLVVVGTALGLAAVILRRWQSPRLRALDEGQSPPLARWAPAALNAVVLVGALAALLAVILPLQ
jgi:hypothetical protein